MRNAYIITEPIIHYQRINFHLFPPPPKKNKQTNKQIEILCFFIITFLLFHVN